MNYSIGVFSKITGLSMDTLRYYEKEQILIIKRDASGRRNYTDEDLLWVSFIKRLKETGMPIRDIKLYASLRQNGNHTVCERLELLQKHRVFALAEKEKWETNLNHLDEKIRLYQEMINKTTE